jgi:multidrug transporter EmrE-like cation transporter
MTPWLWVSAACALEILGDYLLKLWADGGSLRHGAWGSIFYGLGGIAWGFFLRYHPLQRAIIIFAAANVLLAIALGHFAFGERLGARGSLAALLALVALVLADL